MFTTIEFSTLCRCDLGLSKAGHGVLICCFPDQTLFYSLTWVLNINRFKKFKYQNYEY